jgi:release factor glutamine methyltransferase
MRNQNHILKKTSPWTILEVLKWTADYFSANQIDSPRLTAEILLAETLGIERIALYVRFDQPLTEDERARYKGMVKRRILKEPVAYILGRKDFWKIELALTPDVLIPRPETEILVEAALDILSKKQGPEPPRVLDMGTGSGAIVISLAHSMPEMIGYASDISRAALAVAARNAVLNKVGGRVSFFASKWFDSISPAYSFDMIVSNPPYIPSAQIPGLAPEISSYEPVTALDGDVDGLRDIATLVAKGPDYLVPGGTLIIEIGHDQKNAVERMVENQTGCDLYFQKDYSGHDRVAVIRRIK